MLVCLSVSSSAELCRQVLGHWTVRVDGAFFGGAEESHFWEISWNVLGKSMWPQTLHKKQECRFSATDISCGSNLKSYQHDTYWRHKITLCRVIQGHTYDMENAYVRWKGSSDVTCVSRKAGTECSKVYHWLCYWGLRSIVDEHHFFYGLWRHVTGDLEALQSALQLELTGCSKILVSQYQLTRRPIAESSCPCDWRFSLRRYIL